MKRDTTTDLFNATMKAAREAGELQKLDSIMDYENPCNWDVITLTSYQFDILFTSHYGGSEGIYIDAEIRGIFDATGEKKRAHIGTIKTLSTDLDAMKIMGETCGILTHFASQYVNDNLDRYEPEKKEATA